MVKEAAILFCLVLKMQAAALTYIVHVKGAQGISPFMAKSLRRSCSRVN